MSDLLVSDAICTCERWRVSATPAHHLIPSHHHPVSADPPRGRAMPPSAACAQTTWTCISCTGRTGTLGGVNHCQQHLSFGEIPCV